MNYYIYQSALILILIFFAILAFGHGGKKYDTVGYFLIMLTVVSIIISIFFELR